MVFYITVPAQPDITQLTFEGALYTTDTTNSLHA